MEEQLNEPTEPTQLQIDSGRIALLMDALEESVKLQSHYAELLDMHDSGHRLKFKSAEDWLQRLKVVRMGKMNTVRDFEAAQFKLEAIAVEMQNVELPDGYENIGFEMCHAVDIAVDTVKVKIKRLRTLLQE